MPGTGPGPGLERRCGLELLGRGPELGHELDQPGQGPGPGASGFGLEAGLGTGHGAGPGHETVLGPGRRAGGRTRPWVETHRGGWEVQSGWSERAEGGGGYAS